MPILGNSYYEYGSVLLSRNESISLLYAEYALELSNLDIYFPSKDEKINISSDAKLYLHGVLAGILLVLFVSLIRKL